MGENEFSELGFAITEPLLSERARSSYLTAIDRCERAADPAGVRNLTSVVPETLQLLDVAPLRAIVSRALGAKARLVRAILLDKTAARNWNVPWHQDLFIAVKKQEVVPGFDGWTRKAGVVHTRAPVELLQQMVTLRLHLDDCGPKNGPLLVIPRSHRAGLFTDDTRREAVTRLPSVECAVRAGGGMIMRPLLLHSSRAAVCPGRRRVIHLEFAAAPLPPPLEWHLQELA